MITYMHACIHTYMYIHIQQIHGCICLDTRMARAAPALVLAPEPAPGLVPGPAHALSPGPADCGLGFRFESLGFGFESFGFGCRV